MFSISREGSGSGSGARSITTKHRQKEFMADSTAQMRGESVCIVFIRFALLCCNLSVFYWGEGKGEK